jgi:hypothetical protein
MHMYMCSETLSPVLLAETQDANYLDLEAWFCEHTHI